ncbi:MAG TPA: NAD(P)/FAD-dependent oxidoreductase [Actinophytocola sp.]|jgi:flavin-dependent dehydrogenase|uniref:NAD(P)/FAD-dependent oxidoreductase n=1 Tax=Actinophytocola sp. TaxID=1872138 RepID=UPI002F959C2F
MYDAIVVGARCAGASTALLLARRGYRVLLLDKATFPADTMSTLYIHQPGVARLATWGVLDAVVASGCPRLDTITYQVCDVRLAASAATLGEIDCGYAPRRNVLDQILADAAVAAGAEFADGCVVRELRERDGRVTGVVFDSPTGTGSTADARLVVGADGMNSRVADLAGADPTLTDPRLSCVYYTIWSAVDVGFGFFERPGSWIAAIPTSGGATVVASYFPQQRFDQVRVDALGAHLAAVRDTAPELYEQIAGHEPAERLRGTGNQRNFFRRAYGPGWVLAGDAGHHRDTITAHGITNALVQAELLTDSIGDDLADPVRLDRALANFADARDTVLADGYRATLELAQLRVPASRLRMLQAIAEVPELTARYFAMVAGIVPIESVLTTELLELIT